MRTILYTGKGGVGKTSMSAATAVRCAELGRRTVVLSTDAAHSLGDSLDTQVGTSLTPVMPNLQAIEIDVNLELTSNWGKIQEFLTQFLRARGFEEVMAEEFAVFPGMEELFSLLKLKEYHEKDLFDVAIIDCAPTGSTIRMLSMPDIMRWYFEKIFNLHRRVVKAVRPIAERVVNVPLPTDDVFFSLQNLYRRVDGLRAILCDPEQSSIRIVLNPEKMVIKESHRLYTYLNLFGFSVDSIFANKIFPEQVKNSYLSDWIAVQQKHLAECHESFDPIPTFTAELFETEVVGLERLSRFARHVFGDRDPSQVLHREKPMEIRKERGNYVLSLKLPFLDEKELGIWVKGDQLIIQVKNIKRNFFLPRSLAARKLKDARYVDDRLKITFGGKDAQK
ncbi:MAG: TRC40/GET3/ArsA family transport-energizing ATPase [Acidobacteriota bacterium]